MDFNRIPLYIRRAQRARSLGVAASLPQLMTSSGLAAHLPDDLLVNGKRLPVARPNEKGSQDAFIEIFFEDIYGLADAPPPVKTIADVGANAGMFGAQAKLLFPDAQVHCYEPNAGLQSFLEANSQTFGFKYYLEAVDLVGGRVNLNTEYGESVAARTEMTDSGSITAVSFADMVARLGGGVDFVKLDCEGAEWRILQDTQTWRSVRYLSLEYHLHEGAHTSDEALAAVTNIGFKVRGHRVSDYGTGWILANRA